ncbi:MAG: leucine--tRNA ligase [Desulfurococcales archaeon]|nr:leucine--tRNA ligase [Desulfurococcales archaeon]
MRITPKVNPKMVEELKKIEAKWRERWKRDKLFEADPDDTRPKFFVTFPYPYVNAYPHLGGAFTILRVDVTARYKRMRGYNVLFPQGWHATGGPIVAAAIRVRERDKSIVNALKEMGIPDEDIPKFENPVYWVKFFTKAWREDLEKFGMSIDWRREFYTTSLNPAYSRFIEWQYYKLREKGFVGKGTHPVVWCPKELKVVGDHDRPDEYAGISPQEAVIIKFRGDDGLVYPALTYRPETVFGVTNVWVNPDYIYLVARVDGERWIINRYMVDELRDQDYRIDLESTIKGRDLIGRVVENPVTGDKVLILPASFVDPELGTGIVMSVPAHAPYDYVALEELKRDVNVLSSYGLNPSVVAGIRPIPLIRVEGFSEIPARDVVERLGIRSQRESSKLDEATKEVYSKEYHQGVLLDITGRWRGRLVRDVKDEIVSWMVENDYALRIYTLPSRVYCRCGARTHVKIVKDQWFLLYSKPEWKRLAHNAVDSMKFYPEEAREYFHKMIDWYEDWAFTHKGELGTRLPWDEDWVIESLSDSTIYMAYYTIAKYLQHPEKYGIRAEQLDPSLFDYIFLGHGDPREISSKTGIPLDLIEEMRREFLYWYPVDLRISGKDLMPNHLVFFIFHHAAVFPENLWPKGIGLNGWVLVGGEKMSKSKGNFILLRQALDWWGADATRWTEILAGADPGLDDANFEPSVADSAVEDLLSWLRFVEENYGSGREHRLKIDDWFESVLNRTIVKVTQLMDETKYKTALIEGFYNLQSALKWYLRRTGGRPNKDVLKRFIEVQTLLIAPFAPHIADEAWSRIGGRGYASIAPWPEPDYSKINDELETAENIVKEVIEDSRNILKLVKEARRLRVIIASPWKYDLVSNVKEARSRGLTLRDALRDASKRVNRPKAEVGKALSILARKPEILNLLVNRELEISILAEAREFLSKELNIEVIVETEEESDSPKKENAMPGKPALHIE